MYSRLSILLDDKIIKKIRILQARRIKKTKQGCSFSKMVGLLLVHGLKNMKKKSFKTST